MNIEDTLNNYNISYPNIDSNLINQLVIDKTDESYEIADDLFSLGQQLYEEDGDLQKSKWMISTAILIYNLLQKHLEFDHKKGIQFYRRLKKHSISLSDHSQLISAYNGIGEIMLDNGKTSAALQNFNRSNFISTNMRYLNEKAKVLTRIGKVYQRQKKYGEAEETFFESLKIADQIHDGELAAGIFVDLAENCKKYDHPNSAEHFLNASLEIREDINDLEGIQDSFNRLEDLKRYISNFEFEEGYLPPVPLEPQIQVHRDRTAQLGIGKYMESDIYAEVKRTNVINSGFSKLDKPDIEIENNTTLKTDDEVYYWFEIGEKLDKSIEISDISVPNLPKDTELKIVIHEYSGELQVVGGLNIGKLKFSTNEKIVASMQPLQDDKPDSHNINTRLFYKIKTPSLPGEYRLKTNIYWNNILLQSHTINTTVTEEIEIFDERIMLRSDLDYNIMKSFHAQKLAAMKEHSLSISISAENDGTHSFDFFGKNNYIQNDLRIDDVTISALLNKTRSDLRMASWGNRNEWSDDFNFKYTSILGNRHEALEILKKDIFTLAQSGHELYGTISTTFAGGEDYTEKLEDILFSPGYLQLAMKVSERQIIPIANFYDYPIMVGQGPYSLCKTFEESFLKNEQLENTDCFNGNCPSKNDEHTICPSGFWGFRHYIGITLSTQYSPDVVSEIRVSDNLNFTMGIAKHLDLWEIHKTDITKLTTINEDELSYAFKTNEIIDLMKSFPHIVYFYCHGKYRNGGIYLEFGNSEYIFPTNLKYIKFEEPRPLVFINGCHTTAVHPESIINFVRPFIVKLQAAGVIGTEITISEELASRFANEFFNRFIKGEHLGMAIRNTRLKLLQEGNPLGLAYVPYVSPDLRMVSEKQTN